MTMNLTLITSIVITAALTTAGTYYMTTRVQPTADNPVDTAAVQQPQTATQPVAVAMNQEANKPVQVIVRTEIVNKERNRRRVNHVAQGRAARSSPQPHYGILE